MKKLDDVLDIGPKYAAKFEQAGIRTVLDLAKTGNLQELSLRAEVPLELLEQWHLLAKQEVEASRYRRKVLISAVMMLGLLLSAAALWLLRRVSSPTDDSYSQAYTLYEKEDYVGAARVLDEALARGKTTAPLHTLRGTIYLKSSQPKDAIIEFQKALKLDSTSARAWSNLAIAYQELNEPEQAIKQYDKAIELDPEYKFAYARKGYALLDMGRNDEALAALDQAIHLDPNYVWAHFARGIALRRLRRYNEALASLDQAIHLDPEYAWAYAARGLIYHEYLYRYERACGEYKKAYELEPNKAEHRADLAEAGLTSGRFEEAYSFASELLVEDKSAKMLGVAERLSMRLVIISSLLLQGKTEWAKSQLEEFIRYYKGISPDFQQTWIYSGTRNFITNHAMDKQSKHIILELVKLLESRMPKGKIERIEELLSTLK